MKMMTYRQAAELLQLPVGTVYSMVARRGIPHVRLGRRLVRFNRDDIDNWLNDLGVAVAKVSP